MSGIRRLSTARSAIGLIATGSLWLAGSLPVYSTTRLPPAPIPLAGSDNLQPSSLKWKVVELEFPGQTGLVSLRAELADTQAKRETGMMHRKSLPENSGMLFVFDPPVRVSFWMKNTRIPLSIAFIDSQGRILEIRPMKPYDESLIWSVSNAVAYALEVNEGWFDRHGVRLGARIFGIPSLNGKFERRAAAQAEPAAPESTKPSTIQGNGR